MNFIDLKAQYRTIESEIDNSIKAVLEHGQYILGPEVKELESKLAEFVGVTNCVGVSSGTDALLVAMMALGIKPGDEIITTPFTFIATGETIALLGAVPVFVDVDPKTYNMDPGLIKAAITKKTKAIIPVSLYGQCCDFEKINEIAAVHNLPVIEDGAQSFGAQYNSRRSCALSTIGCTSFFPSKPLGAYGDGGACFTDDANLALKMRQISAHGQDRRYHHPVVGINGRLDTLQAAILLVKLKCFEDELKKRDEIGQRYSDLLKHPEITTPFIENGNTSVYAQYTVLLKDRDNVAAQLKARGIPTAVHYPVPLNQQPAIEQVDKVFPVAEDIAGRVLSLPMHPWLSREDQDEIVSAVLASV